MSNNSKLPCLHILAILNHLKLKSWKCYFTNHLIFVEKISSWKPQIFLFDWWSLFQRCIRIKWQKFFWRTIADVISSWILHISVQIDFSSQIKKATKRTIKSLPCKGYKLPFSEFISWSTYKTEIWIAQESSSFICFILTVWSLLWELFDSD